MPDAIADSDAIVVAAATSAHAELIHAGADAGLPIFCEKPISLEIGTTIEAIDHVARAGVPLQIGFQRRFDAGFRAARDLVAAGGLGTLYLVRTAGHDPAPPHEEYIPNSGGIFRDFSIHDFDAIRFVTGQEIVEVTADGRVIAFPVFETLRRRRHGGRHVPVVGRCPGHPVGEPARPARLRHPHGAPRLRRQRRGRRRRAHASSLGRARGSARPQDPYGEFQSRFRPAYEAEMAAFIDVAAGRAESPCTGADALAALRVADACERSRRTRRPVEVGS